MVGQTESAQEAKSNAKPKHESRTEFRVRCELSQSCLMTARKQRRVSVSDVEQNLVNKSRECATLM